MALKWTIQGGLIYSTMALYLAAFLLGVLGRTKGRERYYLAAFLVAALSFGYRWVHVAHVPMQNLFEVFLMMGMLMWPISRFGRQVLGAGLVEVDILLAIVLLVPAGFFFDAEPKALPPALQCWLFAPHVAVYILAYVLMGKAAAQAMGQLYFHRWSPDRSRVYEESTYCMICLGFPLMTLGLVLGCWWGHLAWGDWWGWDPKELWSLVTWLVFLAYFHFRYLCGRRYPCVNSVWAMVAVVAIVITLLWVNLSNLFSGMHSYAT